MIMIPGTGKRVVRKRKDLSEQRRLVVFVVCRSEIAEVQPIKLTLHYREIQQVPLQDQDKSLQDYRRNDLCGIFF
jgi:hypothetical protein